MAADEAEVEKEIEAQEEKEASEEHNEKEQKASILRGKAAVKADALKKKEEAKKRAEAEAKKPVEKKGPIQLAAESRLRHYKARMAAALVQHQYANGEATSRDLEKAKEAVRMAAVNETNTLKAAVAHGVKHGTQSLEIPGSNDATLAGNSSNSTQPASDTRTVQTVKKALKKGPGAPPKETPPKKRPAKTAPQPRKKFVSTLCSEAACKKACKTADCYKYCMRCKTVTAEVVKYVAGSGLVTETTTEHEMVNDPVTVHATWVDAEKRRHARLEKNEKDADHFADQKIRGAYCIHCKEMCRRKKNIVLENACDKACEASAACIAGGKRTFSPDDPMLDSYTQPIVTAADAAEKVARQKSQVEADRQMFQHRAELKALNDEEAKIAADDKREYDALSRKQQLEMAQLEKQKSYSSGRDSDPAVFRGPDPAVVLAMKHEAERNQLMLKQHGQTIKGLRKRLARTEQHPSQQPLNAPVNMDAALATAAKAGATVIHLPSTTVVQTVHVKPTKKKQSHAAIKKLVKNAVHSKAAELKKEHVQAQTMIRTAQKEKERQRDRDDAAGVSLDVGDDSVAMTDH
jgi:hypothetical protein